MKRDPRRDVRLPAASATATVWADFAVAAGPVELVAIRIAVGPVQPEHRALSGVVDAGAAKAR